MTRLASALFMLMTATASAETGSSAITRSQLFTYAMANRASLDCPQAMDKRNAGKFVEKFHELSTAFSDEERAIVADADDLFDLRSSVEGIDAICAEFAPYFN